MEVCNPGLTSQGAFDLGIYDAILYVQEGLTQFIQELNIQNGESLLGHGVWGFSFVRN